MTNKPANETSLNIDICKRDALACLSTKHDKPRRYPIASSDLITVNQCPLCHSTNLSLISQVYLRGKLNFLATSACNHCLFTFRSVSPRLGWFKRCWQAIYNGKLEVFNPSVEKSRKRRYLKYFRKLAKYCHGRTLLDIGAAYGTGANVFRTNGWTVHTVEPEISKVRYIKTFYRLPVVADSIENYVHKKRRYALIIFAQCLEHIDHPDIVLKRMGNLLARDGILYIEIPTLWDCVNWSDSLYLPHKSNFTKENIMAYLKQCGFQILETFYVRQHSQGTLWAFGIVAQLTGEHRQFKIKSTRIINDVKTQYRKDLPLAKRPPLDQILKYDVPYIEEFFQTLNLLNRRMIGPRPGYEFISFKKDALTH